MIKHTQERVSHIKRCLLAIWVLSASVLSFSLSAAQEAPNFVEAITVSGGYVGSYHSTDTENGGVSGIADSSENGYGFNLSATFSPEIFESTRAYLDYQSINQDDRSFQIPGIGLRYDFEARSNPLQPYAKLGLNYVYLDWNTPPTTELVNGHRSGESLGISAQAGLDFYLSDHWALGGLIRLDSYDIGTVIVNNNATTTLNDNASLSAMLSLSYRFNAPSSVTNSEPEFVTPVNTEITDINTAIDTNIDTDKDGVFDRSDICRETLRHVPVKENGCPLDAFEFDLMFEFDEYQLTKLTSKTTFPFVQFMQNNPSFRVLISGYTDERGTVEYNQILSEKRARSAKQHLVEQGIDAAKISAIGRGKMRAITSEQSTEAELSDKQARQRRITVTFYNPKRIQP